MSSGASAVCWSVRRRFLPTIRKCNPCSYIFKISSIHFLRWNIAIICNILKGTLICLLGLRPFFIYQNPYLLSKWTWTALAFKIFPAFQKWKQTFLFFWGGEGYVCALLMLPCNTATCLVVLFLFLSLHFVFLVPSRLLLRTKIRPQHPLNSLF